MRDDNKPYRLTGSWTRAAEGVLYNALEQNGYVMEDAGPGEDGYVGLIAADGMRVEETVDGVRTHGRAVGESGLVADKVHVRFETETRGGGEGVQITDLETDIGFRWYDEDLEMNDVRPIVTAAACSGLTAGDLGERLYRCLFAAGRGMPVDSDSVVMAELIAKAQALRVANRDAGNAPPERTRTWRYAFRRIGNRLESMALPNHGGDAAAVAHRMRRAEAWRARATDWHDDHAEYTGDASEERLDAVATMARLEKAGYALDARLPMRNDDGCTLEIWSHGNAERLRYHARVQVIVDGSGTTRVTTESGATTLSEVTADPEDDDARWVTEIHPTGVRKRNRERSYRDAVGRAVDHALERQQNK